MIGWIVCFVLAILFPIGGLVLGSALFAHNFHEYKVKLATERKKTFSKSPLWESFLLWFAVGTLAGGIMVFIPPMFAIYPDSAVLGSVQSTFYMIMWEFGGSQFYTAICGAGLSEAFATAYFTLAQIYSFLVPISCTGAVLGIVTTRFPYVQFFFSRLLKRKSDVFVFAEVNEHSLTLVQDILKTGILAKEEAFNGKRPLILFCSCSKNEKDMFSAEIKKIKACGSLSTIFLADACADIVVKLKHQKDKHFLVISEDSGKNVNESLEIVESIVNYVLERQDLCNERAQAEEAFKFHVYCLHENEEDELLADSLFVDSATGAIDAKKEEIRRHIEYRLVSETEDRVRELFARYPLYSVLDWEEVQKARCGEQKVPLEVVILGLGKIGKESLRSAFWLGRMPGVKLHITAVDLYAPKIARKLWSDYPEMMRELNGVIGERYDAETIGLGDEFFKTLYGTGKAEDSLDTPPFTIQLMQKDIFTDDLYAVLDSATNKKGVNPYIIIALGSDELNYQTALRVRRYFDEQIFAEQDQILHHGTNRASIQDPLITFCVELPEFRDIISRLRVVDEKHEFIPGEKGACQVKGRYELFPFGDTAEVYSYRHFIAAPWEKIAHNASAVYEQNADALQARYEFNAKEYLKQSNRTHVRYLPTRFWCEGLACTLVDSNAGMHFEIRDMQTGELATNETWLRAIGIHMSIGSDAQSAEEQIARISADSSFEELDLFKKNYARLMEIAKVEHDRWTAFYESRGWAGLSVEGVKQVRVSHKKPMKVHQSLRLKRHCYICSMDEAIRIGYDAINKKDVNSYDRKFIIESYRVFTQDFVKQRH